MKLNAIVLGCFLLAAAAVWVSVWRPTPPAVVAAADKPVVQWSVSRAYTVDNKVVPGMMIASADSVDGKDEMSVRCSVGFSAVYVRPETAPAPEAGTPDATYISSVDGSPEVVGHAVMAGRNMKVGNAATVRQLAHARSLRIRFTPFDSSSLSTVDFDVRGLGAALGQMRDVCGSI
jgi:hypothetical protein